jgi:hypothetical protein
MRKLNYFLISFILLVVFVCSISLSNPSSAETFNYTFGIKRVNDFSFLTNVKKCLDVTLILT